jgi:hypothetical protein
MKSIEEEFTKWGSDHYLCYVVRSKVWHNERQQYFDTKLALFNNESDANKCLVILQDYAHRYHNYANRYHNCLEKEIFVYDGQTIHTMSGHKVDYDEYVRNKEYFERVFALNSWGYMDFYVKFFGHKRLRPRSTLFSVITFLTCCCCFVDPFMYEIPDLPHSLDELETFQNLLKSDSTSKLRRD